MSIQSAPVTLAGPVGAIEALVETDDSDGWSPRGIAVVCHPHPLHEGTMHNKVAYMLARSAVELGLAAVRFNFRGVGASEGSYAQGEGELDDAVAVLDAARARVPDGPLWVAGFSFGGAVALRASMRRELDQVIAAAPAVEHFDVSEASPRCPWLILQGDADELVPADVVKTWHEGLNDSRATLLMSEDTGHFFHGKLVWLKRQLLSHLATS